jgi:pimeloyl-ACP methyl ester carboxylesterase
MVKLSPSGKYITNHYKTKNDHFIELIDHAKSESVYSFRIGKDNTLEEYYWLNDQYLYFVFLQDGDQRIMIGELIDNKIKLKLLEAEGHLIYTLPEEKNRVMFERRQSSNGAYFYDFYTVEIEALIKNDFDDAVKLKHNAKEVREYRYDPRAKQVIMYDYDRKTKIRHFKSVHINGGKWKTIFLLKNRDYRFGVLGFKSENMMYVLTNKNSDKVVLREFNIEKQALEKTIYQHPKYDLKSAGFTGSGDLDYVTYRQHGLVRTVFFDKGKVEFEERISSTFKNKDAFFIDQSDDKNTYLLYVNGSDQPGEYYIYDRTNDLINRLFVSFSKLADIKFSRSEHLEVKTPDNVEIEAFLTIPQANNLNTLLVMPHGGPIDVQESDRFNKQVQYFASRGFSVLRVNFRGSSGFGKAFLSQGVGEFGKLIESDITAAVNLVKKKHQFKYMCSIGASYGGYSAAMLAIKYPEQYDCVIASFGIYDLPLLFNASNYRSDEKFRESIEKVAGKYDRNMVEYSPIYLNEKLKAPILLIAGRLDDIADFEHSNRFKFVLEERKHNVETMFYENTEHGHKYWNGDRHEAATTYDFLVRTLKLPIPTISPSSSSSKSALANDFYVIAKSLANEDNVPDDMDKALTYYHKAASLDHGESNYFLADYFLNGSLETKDVKRGLDYLKKSAELSYAPAYAKFGRMYMEGENFERNWIKASNNLNRAAELSNTPSNRIRLARFYCMAPEESRDIDLCLKLMDLEQYYKQSKSKTNEALGIVSETISWVMAEGNLTQEEFVKVRDFAIELYDVTELEVSLENVTEGLFSYKGGLSFGNKSVYDLINKSALIQTDDIENTAFGVIFELNVFGADRYRDNISLAMRWIKTTPSGEKSYLKSMILSGSPKGKWRLLRELSDIKEPAVWTIEVYDLNQKKLYQKSFDVKLPIESPPMET